MKINMKVNELTDGDVSMISLVKNGAIRAPFKILKADELPQGHSNLGDRISGFFKGATSKDPVVTAVFVKVDKLKETLPVLAEVGLSPDIEKSTVVGDVAILKYDGYVEEEVGTVIALTNDVAVGFGSVIKEFETYVGSTDFDF